MSGISSLMAESRVFKPSSDFTKQANLNAEDYESLCTEAERDYPAYWARLANTFLDWKKPFT